MQKDRNVIKYQIDMVGSMRNDMRLLKALFFENKDKDSS